MIWRLLTLTIAMSACASTVWKNEKEALTTVYADEVIDYFDLDDEVLFTLKNYLSGKLMLLIDHASNATNEQYSAFHRDYSKTQVSNMIHIDITEDSDQVVKEITYELKRASFDEFIIEPPVLDKDSALYYNILLRGQRFLRARIKQHLEIFEMDTLESWKVEFYYLKEK